MRASAVLASTACLLWLASATPAMALVTGTPEPPAPGTPPQWWLSNGNDAFGVPSRPGTAPSDDFRTAEATLAGCPGDHLAIVVDESLFTDRDGGTRVDEVTATLGGRLEREAPGMRLWGADGVGVRVLGNAGGQRIQDVTHRVLGDERFELREDPLRWSGVGYLFVAARSPPGPLGWDCVGTALATSRGQGESEVALRADAEFALFDAPVRLWLGGRWRGEAGPPPTPTASAVAASERGVALDFGLAYGWFVLAETWNRHRAYGIISLVISP
jgi:hypothetical protein